MGYLYYLEFQDVVIGWYKDSSNHISKKKRSTVVVLKYLTILYNNIYFMKWHFIL